MLIYFRFFLSLIIPPPSASTLFPYTTLFRSPSLQELAIASSKSLPSSKFLVTPLVIPELKPAPAERSEEHTSELQSRGHIVCRLLLEKKNYCLFSFCFSSLLSWLDSLVSIFY